MHFILSSLIFMLLQLPMMLLSFLVTPLLCLTKWEGFTTWFGNDKWGRGDTHYKAPSEGVYWKQVRFLCIRNPIANFGTLGPVSAPNMPVNIVRFPWLHDQHLGGGWYWKYGWKNPREASSAVGIVYPAGSLYQPDGRRSFVFRPWKHRV